MTWLAISGWLAVVYAVCCVVWGIVRYIRKRGAA